MRRSGGRGKGSGDKRRLRETVGVVHIAAAILSIIRHRCGLFITKIARKGREIMGRRVRNGRGEEAGEGQRGDRGKEEECSRGEFQLCASSLFRPCKQHQISSWEKSLVSLSFSYDLHPICENCLVVPVFFSLSICLPRHDRRACSNSLFLFVHKSLLAARHSQSHTVRLKRGSTGLASQK